MSWNLDLHFSLFMALDKYFTSLGLLDLENEDEDHGGGLSVVGKCSERGGPRAQPQLVALVILPVSGKNSG